MRRVLAVLASTALVGSVVGVPAAVPAVAAASTTISGWSTTAAAGAVGYSFQQRVRVKTGSEYSAREVQVQRRAVGASWSSVVTGATDEAGYFTAPLTVPAVGAFDFRLVVPATRTAASAQSGARRITGVAGAQTSISGWSSAPSNASTATGLVVRLTVKTGPSYATRTALVQRKAAASKAWSTVRTTSTGAAGAVSVALTGSVGSWDFRVLVPATPTAASVATASRRVTLFAPRAVAAGGWHSCALIAGGSVKCWGSNGYGQLGDGTIATRRTPVAVPGLSGATAISAGGWHTCALFGSGTIRCWGANGYGQLGDGTTTDRYKPVTVSGITGATAISAGYGHTCAVLASGAMKCWGWNVVGQLGDGSTTDRYKPVTVSGITGTAGATGATASTAGYVHTCALLTSGGLACWGDNDVGQIGDGTTTDRYRPVTVSGISGARAIMASSGHTCAALVGGSARCWGNNGGGQLGDGTTTERHRPVAVSGLSGASAILAGDDHTCALLTGGTVKCWGNNEVGQLGDGTTTDRHRPVTVSGITGASAVTSGNDHSCALVTEGSVECWGNNEDGQLGDGTKKQRRAPVAVVGIP